jgi:hypothetical protein
MVARVSCGKWRYHDETNAQSRAVYRHHFRDRRNTRAAAQSLSGALFVTAGGALHGSSVRPLMDEFNFWVCTGLGALRWHTAAATFPHSMSKESF